MGGGWGHGGTSIQDSIFHMEAATEVASACLLALLRLAPSFIFVEKVPLLQTAVCHQAAWVGGGSS